MLVFQKKIEYTPNGILVGNGLRKTRIRNPTQVWDQFRITEIVNGLIYPWN